MRTMLPFLLLDVHDASIPVPAAHACLAAYLALGEVVR